MAVVSSMPTSVSHTIQETVAVISATRITTCVQSSSLLPFTVCIVSFFPLVEVFYFVRQKYAHHRSARCCVLTLNILAPTRAECEYEQKMFGLSARATSNAEFDYCQTAKALACTPTVGLGYGPAVKSWPNP